VREIFNAAGKDAPIRATASKGKVAYFLTPTLLGKQVIHFEEGTLFGAAAEQELILARLPSRRLAVPN